MNKHTQHTKNENSLHWSQIIYFVYFRELHQFTDLLCNMIDSDYSLPFIGENDTTERLFDGIIGILTKPDPSLPIQTNTTKLPTNLGSSSFASVNARACQFLCMLQRNATVLHTYKQKKL